MPNDLKKLTEGSIKTNVRPPPKTKKPLIDPAPQNPDYKDAYDKAFKKSHNKLRQRLSRLDLSGQTKSSIENGKEVVRLKASVIDQILKLIE